MNKKWFQEVEKYDDDLAAFEKQLSDANINFRVFNISVPIRAAKWSEAFAPAPKALTPARISHLHLPRGRPPSPRARPYLSHQQKKRTGGDSPPVLPHTLAILFKYND
jgi:hypothetical protein